MRWHARGLDQLFFPLFAARASALDGRGCCVDRRWLGHAHHFVRQIVRFALVAVTWLVDQGLSLYQCGGSMHRNTAEVVSDSRYGIALQFGDRVRLAASSRVGSIGYRSDRGDNMLRCLRLLRELVHDR